MKTKSKVMVYVNGIKIPVEMSEIEFEDGTKIGDLVDGIQSRLDELEKKAGELQAKADKHETAIKTVAGDLDLAKQEIIELAGSQGE